MSLLCLTVFLLVGIVYCSNSCNDGVCQTKFGNLIIGRESQLTATSNASARNSIQNVVATPNWWQSKAGEEEVNIQFDLESEMLFSNILILFKDHIPGKMLIEKSRNYGRSWSVYQYYSKNCSDDYPGIKEGDKLNINEVTCISRYSQNRNNTEPGILFRALPTNYSDYNPWTSEKMEAMILTNIRIKLLSFPDDPEETIDHYAITKIYIRGTCACYGHAKKCFSESGAKPGRVSSKCQCIDNTVGRNCEMCSPLHNNHPWKPSVECSACECHGHSETCHFDPLIFDMSNSTKGGVCDNCIHDTVGVDCEQCLPQHFRNPGVDISNHETCLPCNCNQTGSTGPNCELSGGQCPCKPGVTGRTCDQDRLSAYSSNV